MVLYIFFFCHNPKKNFAKPQDLEKKTSGVKGCLACASFHGDKLFSRGAKPEVRGGIKTSIQAPPKNVEGRSTKEREYKTWVVFFFVCFLDTFTFWATVTQTRDILELSGLEGSAKKKK